MSRADICVEHCNSFLEKSKNLALEVKDNTRLKYVKAEIVTDSIAVLLFLTSSTECSRRLNHATGSLHPNSLVERANPQMCG